MAPRAAPAQDAVGPADVEAARALYKEGFALQTAGDYAGALERFRRSQRVYPAPTALLHIAECEAQLLQLVEAAETYRQLVRQPLPPGSNPAFVAAQTQGAAELQQVEPRIPHVRIDVTPANVQGLVVTVDGEPMNTALLGVDRPIDPGSRTVAAMAPGYERAEQVLTFAEKGATKAIVFALKPAAGPAQALGPAGAAPQVVYLNPAVGQPPTYYPVPPTSPAADAPSASPSAWEPPPPRPAVSRSSLFFGPRLGAVVPYGSNLTSTASAGASVGLEVDYRFARRFFVGVVGDHGFLGGAGTTSKASTNAGAATVGVMTNPDQFGALFELGIGYRALTETGATGSGLPASATAYSTEFQIGLGMWVPLGKRVRLCPRLETTFGSFNTTIADAQGGSGASSGYAMITFALGGYYDLAFK